MIGQAFPIRSLALATCIVMAAAPLMAQNRAARRQAVIIPFSKAESNREYYVAIMGAVSRPGTYHLDPSKLNLRTVIGLAGGVTPDPTTTIRVIRSGRENQQITYSESVAQSDCPILPGDLLIVETKSGPVNAGQVVDFDRDPAAVRAVYEEQPEPKGVQVALVNVLEYPIVFSFANEDATPGRILELLGQEREALPNYAVIGSGRGNRGFVQASHSMPLTPMSTLVFDHGSIKHDRLPKTLPRPIESDIEFGAQSGLIGNPSGQSEQLLNVGRRASLPENGSRELPPIPPVSVERTPIQVPKEAEELELPPTVSTSKPRIANLPFTGDAPISKSSTASPRFEVEPTESIPQLTQSPIETAPELPQADPLSIDEQPLPPSNSSGAITLVIAIGLISLALVGITILTRKRFPAKGIEQTIEAATEPSEIEIPPEPIRAPVAINRPAPMTLLERMIKNQIPLTVESVEFPSELALQGKILAKPILRVDGPQNVSNQNGPHFAPQEQEAGQQTIHEIIAKADAPESMPRRPHFIRSQKSSTLTSASSGPGPQSSGERSDAPLANALFELERGGRS